MLALGAIFVAFSGCAGSPDPGAPTEVVASTPTPNPAAARDQFVAKIYDAARRNDEAALTGARDDLVKAGKSPDPALALALFAVDPDKYRDGFVAAYPADDDGVNVDYGSRLVASHLRSSGALFPIQAVGSLAAHGDAAAQKKLIVALTQARGTIADAYRREAGADFVELPPADALAALTSLAVPVRLAATSEIDWCHRKTGPLLDYVPTPSPLPSGVTASPAISVATSNPDASPTPTSSLVFVQRQIHDAQLSCAVATVGHRHGKQASQRHSRGKGRGHGKSASKGRAGKA